jgi:hypothetical protein
MAHATFKLQVTAAVVGGGATVQARRRTKIVVALPFPL